MIIGVPMSAAYLIVTIAIITPTWARGTTRSAWW